MYPFFCFHKNIVRTSEMSNRYIKKILIFSFSFPSRFCFTCIFFFFYLPFFLLMLHYIKLHKGLIKWQENPISSTKSSSSSRKITSPTPRSPLKPHRNSSQMSFARQFRRKKFPPHLLQHPLLRLPFLFRSPRHRLPHPSAVRSPISQTWAGRNCVPRYSNAGHVNFVKHGTTPFSAKGLWMRR